ncbi:beta-N-acetylhexosaminidase [Hamadaea tsunoensis]|uniref:beta-N-acetylhexosaminidase n=1 Tax=Hamadaea tsunoensis TaxID=53368 RepID=UPI0003FF98DE|nr:beta-N-acetylhexosaminidase [Hamadaea tsunoensis]
MITRMLPRALLPAPTRVTWLEGSCALTGVTAPPAIAELAYELLGLSSGPGLTARIVDDPSLGDEGYRLSARPEGIIAEAAAEAGLRWSLQTVRQLLSPGEYAIPAVEIEDIPRMGWRGALLDVARWCHPIEFVHKFVDEMAMHKLNTLHLHLTDDQGWRFEVKAYPRLTEAGAWRRESSLGPGRDGKFDGRPHGGFYTQEQLRDLVAYAARRGVRVLPEIDLPGHMQAAVCAYPWLGNLDEQLEVRTAWGISEHVLNTDDATLDFARTVLDEVVSVFPFEYVHLGGDEVPLTEWRANPRALARVAAEGLGGVHELLGWWTARMGEHLATHGRRIAGWDELVDAAPPADTLIFAWRGAERVDAALAAGHQVIAVPQEYVYLDWPQTDDPREPLAISQPPTPLERVYGFDPLRPGVLGTQGMLWSEYTPTPDLVEWRAWPRLAALAEVAWSGRSADFEERLAAHLPRLAAMGVNYHRF